MSVAISKTTPSGPPARRAWSRNLALPLMKLWSVGVKQLKIDNCRLKIEMKILFWILLRFLMDKQSKIVNLKSKILMAPLLHYSAPIMGLHFKVEFIALKISQEDFKDERRAAIWKNHRHHVEGP